MNVHRSGEGVTAISRKRAQTVNPRARVDLHVLDVRIADVKSFDLNERTSRPSTEVCEHGYATTARRRFSELLILSIGLGLVACRDANKLPTAPPQTEAVQTSASVSSTTGGVPGHEMFAIHLSIVGEPRAGADVVVIVEAEALASSKMAQLRVLTPELEAAMASSWDQNFRIPVEVTIAPKLQWSGPLEIGQTVRRSFTLVIPTSGYYRVTAQILLGPSNS